VFLAYFAAACELNVLQTDVLRKIYGRVYVCVCVSETHRESEGGRQSTEGRGNLHTERRHSLFRSYNTFGVISRD
jgi:hypothetical protein